MKLDRGRCQGPLVQEAMAGRSSGGNRASPQGGQASHCLRQLCHRGGLHATPIHMCQTPEIQRQDGDLEKCKKTETNWNLYKRGPKRHDHGKETGTDAKPPCGKGEWENIVKNMLRA